MAYIGKQPLIKTSRLEDSIITENKLAANSVGSTKLIDGSVSETDIASSAVTNAKIAGLNITENKIATSAVTNAKIADLNISENKISSSAITEAKIAAGAVTETKIGTGAVTNSKIATNAVSSDKLATRIDLANPNLTNGAFERANVINSSVPTNLTYAVLDQSIIYYTGNSTGNVTINFIGNTTTSLNDALNNTANTITAVLLMTNGATPYYVNNVLINGTIVHNAAIKGNLFWQGNILQVGGYSVSVDAYGFTFIKRAANTFTIIASQTNNKSLLV